MADASIAHVKSSWISWSFLTLWCDEFVILSFRSDTFMCELDIRLFKCCASKCNHCVMIRGPSTSFWHTHVVLYSTRFPMKTETWHLGHLANLCCRRRFSASRVELMWHISRRHTACCVRQKLVLGPLIFWPWQCYRYGVMRSQGIILTRRTARLVVALPFSL